MQYGLSLCTFVQMSRRQQKRKSGKAKRHATSPAKPPASNEIVRPATQVERLAYTRTQAAEALGISPTTFGRRVLPLIETIEMPWGPRLVPVDELERFVNERRRPARGRAQTAPPGRPPVVPDELVLHIRAEHARGKSLRQIASGLNASRTPTAHGGAQWWPSTVRAVLARSTGTEVGGTRSAD
jgi:hypothetical protein